MYRADPTQTFAFRRRVWLARAAAAFEALWTALWPALGVLGLFLVVVAGVLTVSLTFAMQILVYTAGALALLLVVTLCDAVLGAGQRAPVPFGETPKWAQHMNLRQLVGRLREVFDWRVAGLGVFLFAGSTGTGKTELAKTVAEFLFGSVERMIRLDMSEFQSAETTHKILGGEDADKEVQQHAGQADPFESSTNGQRLVGPGRDAEAADQTPRPRHHGQHDQIVRCDSTHDDQQTERGQAGQGDQR